MAIKWKKTTNYTAGQQIKLVDLGLGGRMGAGTAPLEGGGGGGGGGGGALNPLAAGDTRPATLLDVASSLGSAVYSSENITAAVDSASRGGGYYSVYYVFELNPGDEGDYTFEITASSLDTYMYLHSTADSTAYSYLNLIDEDDDDGAGSLSRIVWTYDGLAPFTGAIEVTTYSSGYTGSFTLTVTGVAAGGGGGGGGGGSPLTYGGSTVEAGWSVSYYKGTSTTLDTTDPDTTYSISSGGSVVASGNMPIDIDTLGLAVGPSGSPISYTVVASGLTFTMDGIGSTRISNYDGNSGTSVVAEGMYIYFNRSADPATLSTDFVDTSYTLVSGSTTLSGSMPVDLNSLNLTPSYYTDPTGPSPSYVISTYAGTASGASFTLQVNGNVKLGFSSISSGYSENYTAGSSVVLSSTYPTAQATYSLYAKGAGGTDFGGALLESGNLPVNLNTLESLAPGFGYTIILGSGEWFPLVVS